MQIHVRKGMPWQEDPSKNVVGSNSGASKDFFHEIYFKVSLYNNLVVENVHLTGVSFINVSIVSSVNM